MNKTAARICTGRTVVCLLTAVAAILKFAAVAGAAGMIWIHLCGSYTPGSGTTGGTIGVATSGASHSRQHAVSMSLNADRICERDGGVR